MPVIRCSSEGLPGFKFGSKGKCYTYEEGDAEGRASARRKAEAQGQAIGGYYNQAPVSLPKYVLDAIKKGLQLYDQGLAGDGLTDGTVKAAKDAVGSGSWPAEKIIKAAAWFARHVADRERMLDPEAWDQAPDYSPAYVAWLLWGSDSDDKGAEFMEKTAEKIKRTAELNGADTPAPKKDRIVGSDTNEPGSAASDGGQIKLNESINKALKAKVETHNKKYLGDGQKATLAMLQKVYRRGAGAYSTSHRPGISRAAWAMARVNAFLYLLAKGKPKNAKYITDNDLLPVGHPIKMREANKMTAAETEQISMAMPDDEFKHEIKKYLQYSVNEEDDLHVMRLGPLHDLMTGELVIDLTDELAKTISENTQKMIEAGHFLPISFEHGIEARQRSEDGDPRPYGHITNVYYRPGKGIYASKVWSKLGLKLVQDSMSLDGESSLRVSPRVNSGTIYSPETGEEMGSGGVIDVVSLTTMPRQNKMQFVPMSRPLKNNKQVEMITEDNMASVDVVETKTSVKKDDNMAEKKESQILFSKGDKQHQELLAVTGLKASDSAEKLVGKVVEMSKAIDAQLETIQVYEAEQAAREAAKKAADVDAYLGSHDLSDGELELYRSILLEGDEQTAELARKTLDQRKAVDPMIAVNEAIEEAKAAGALPADFDLSERAVEMSRQSPEVVIEIIKSNAANAVVNVGNPEGSDQAGLEEPVQLSKEDAGVELSKLARQLYREKTAGGQIVSLTECINLVKNEKPQLQQILSGE